MHHRRIFLHFLGLRGKYVTSPKIILITENHTYIRKSYLYLKIILISENHTYLESRCAIYHTVKDPYISMGWPAAGGDLSV